MKISQIQTNNPLILKDDGIYYERKIDWFLNQWKQTANHLPLVIKGLRQSGKSKSIIHFAISHYKTVFYVDFRNHPEYDKLFSDYDVDNIKERLSIEFGFTGWKEKETLLIFDEIQDCPIARGSLKNFCIDGRYDVIASGSMLGISGYNDKCKQYIPVGYERVVEFHPLDFEEFLWVYGLNKEMTDLFRDAIKEVKPIDPSIHEAMFRLFRTYLIVGGMPSVVKEYFLNRDLASVRDAQIGLMASYRDDFGKHLGEDGGTAIRSLEKAKINLVLDSMPAQLTKEMGSKFTYNAIADSHAKGSKYAGAIEWLVDYGLLSRCPSLSKLDVVQAGYASERNFKLYFADTGLFVSQLDPSFARSIYFDSLSDFKGAIYENVAADAFSKSGRRLYYYEIGYQNEIDFVTTYQGKIALVEVKAKKGKVHNTEKFVENQPNKDDYLILKLTSQNIGKAGNLLTIPYYLAGFLPKEEETMKGMGALLPDVEELKEAFRK